ncbi:MAG: glutamate cyclase domain-containing protein [Planctomycetota bacterium]|jgi:hypothetical protein
MSLATNVKYVGESYFFHKDGGITMVSGTHLLAATDAIDRLCNIEMRLGGDHIHNVTTRIYDAARSKADEPFTLSAARRLVESVNQGDTIFILTGAGRAGGLWLPQGETDGPPGAAAIGRTLALGLEAKPIFIIEEAFVEPLEAALNALGIVVTDYDKVKSRTSAAAIEFLPLDDGKAKNKAEEMIARYNPSVLIAIEKSGPNEKGILHTSKGADTTAGKGKAHHFFDVAQREGILTIGVGDNGNEMGFGNILEDVKKIQPYGAKCQCPCGAGMATVVGADVFVPSAISNWGAYGIAAAIALLKENQSLLHSPQEEIRMIEECARAGGEDGILNRQIPWVDGTSDECQRAIITLLHMIVSNKLKG